MAWTLVGLTTVVVDSGGVTYTINEPAGVADGDLLITCIATRTTATTPITNTGWTAVNSQNNNNTLTTTSALASGTMLYQIRAGTPDTSFVVPAGVSISRGLMLAYRGNATTSPLDVSIASTQPINTLAVSATGLTTTVDNDLIVAMCAGGQEATWSAFNATSPSGASGATDTTTAPSATWRERHDSSTTTGADTSIAVFDAVKTAAGATGNFTATASLGAGHVVIAGAFKILLPTANAWSNADKSAAITLTNSDKKATLASATASGVRSTTTYANGTAGKYYAEFFLNGTAIPDNIGITPTSNSLTSESFNWHVDGTGLIAVNSLGYETISIALNDVVCVAWDAGAERAWFRSNGGNWNNSGTANPATGTGGLDCSFAASTQHALWMRDFNTIGAGATIRTELAEFTQTVPSGFSSWMGEAPPTADAWSNVDKSANITLSNSDKTATSTSATTAGIRSDQKHVNETAGKYYAEIYIVTKTGGINLGIQRTSTAVTTTTNAVVNYGTGTGALSVNSVTVATIATSTSGDVVCFAWDAGAQRIWVRKNGDLWNADAGADPATGTNGLDASALAAEDFALWGISTASGNVITIRTEAAEFTQSGPAGFTSWMGEALGPTAYTLPAVAGAYALTGVAASLEKSRFITAVAGSYALTGTDATLTKGVALAAYNLPAAAGSYALTGATAGLYRGREVLAVAGSYALTGQTASLEYGREATADAGSYALTGAATSLELGREVVALAGSYALAGSVASLELGREVLALSGSYALTGADATLTKGAAIVHRTLPAIAGAYTLTGTDANLEAGREVLAVAGAYAVTGATSNLEYGREVLVVAGSYALTGTAAAFRKTVIMPAIAGAYSLTGATTSFKRTYLAPAVSGSYTLTGIPVNLLKPGAYAVIGLPGNYTLSGAATGLEYGREVLATAAVYALTGADTSLEKGREVLAVAGSYALTGTPASLERGREAVADAGSYALTGVAASLEYGREVLAAGGSYALTGTATSLERGYEVLAVAGSYALTGTPANLLRPGAFAIIGLPGTYTLTGTVASLECGLEVVAEAGSYTLTGSPVTLIYSGEVIPVSPPGMPYWGPSGGHIPEKQMRRAIRRLLAAEARKPKKKRRPPAELAEKLLAKLPAKGLGRLEMKGLAGFIGEGLAELLPQYFFPEKIYDKTALENAVLFLLQQAIDRLQDEEDDDEAVAMLLLTAA